MIKEKEDYSVKELKEMLWFICEQSYSHGSPWNEKQFEEDIRLENSYYLLAMAENSVVGFINFHCIVEEAELINIAILPHYQGQKIAQKLVAEMVVKLVKLKADAIFLEVRKNNEQAINLYKKIGFETIGIRKNYYKNPKEDGLVMSLEIEQEVEK